MYLKFVNVIQDGDLHIWCFDLIVMIQIIVEHTKKHVFLVSQIFYNKLNFLIQKFYTKKCRHNDGVLTHIGSETLSRIH